ncbi:MAG: hypothetical protein CL432_05505 [Acidimicrobiaceae bacterium]|nr:hypothetical protein [Acidimicrobiaceae bacterium]
MGAYKQPNPITEGWAVYRKMVDTHIMSGYPYTKCLTHKDCHLDSFYPGKLYRSMKLERDANGCLRLVKL